MGCLMKQRYSFLVILILCISSCTHRPKYFTIYDINYETKNKKVQLTLSNGQNLEVKGFRITADSSYWHNLTTGKKQSVATSDVKSVAIKRRGRGALEGLGFGGVIGFSIGALIGLNEGGDPQKGFFYLTAEEKAIIYGIYFGAIGGLVGIPVGAAVGSKDRFDIENEK